MTTNFGSSHTNGIMPEGLLAEDRLFESNVETRNVTLARGAVHARGEALGKVTATGKYVLSVASATDGSQVIDAILLVDVDATNSDVQQIAAISGDFAPEGLILGAGHTLASIEAPCRQRRIFLDSVIG